MPSELPLTGERTVPGIAEENYWFRRHEAAYEFARTRTVGRTVLEVGCGEGYGTHLQAQTATTIIGIDYDVATTQHVRAKYPDVHVVRANLAALPIRTDSVEALVTLQVIEHVWDHPQFVRECHRALAPDGLLLVTTPNRLTFSPGLDKPVNPFHTKEFTADELTGLLGSQGFVIDQVLGLHAGDRLAALDATYGSFVDAQLATPPAQWSEQLLADVISVGIDDFTLVGHGTRDVDESLDLVVLARAR